MSKLTLIIMLLLPLLFVVGCELTDEDKQEIQRLNKENIELGFKIKELGESLADSLRQIEKQVSQGVLTQGDATAKFTRLKESFMLIKKEAEDQVSDNITSISNIKQKGVSSSEIWLYTAGNILFTLLGRGLPSKGPLSGLRKMAGGTLRED